MEQLYDYYLHFNPYTGYWNAVPRDRSIQYLNGTLSEDEVIKSKDVNIIINFISKGKHKLKEVTNPIVVKIKD